MMIATIIIILVDAVVDKYIDILYTMDPMYYQERHINSYADLWIFIFNNGTYTSPSFKTSRQVTFKEIIHRVREIHPRKFDLYCNPTVNSEYSYNTYTRADFNTVSSQYCIGRLCGIGDREKTLAICNIEEREKYPTTCEIGTYFANLFIKEQFSAGIYVLEFIKGLIQFLFRVNLGPYQGPPPSRNILADHILDLLWTFKTNLKFFAIYHENLDPYSSMDTWPRHMNAPQFKRAEERLNQLIQLNPQIRNVGVDVRQADADRMLTAIGQTVESPRGMQDDILAQGKKRRTRRRRRRRKKQTKRRRRQKKSK